MLTMGRKFRAMRKNSTNKFILCQNSNLIIDRYLDEYDDHKLLYYNEYKIFSQAVFILRYTIMFSQAVYYFALMMQKILIMSLKKESWRHL
jgi:hypothetical protein